jgi:uncharacterized damage-inducible protein DinB
MRIFAILARYNASFNQQLGRILASRFERLPQPLVSQINHIFVMDRIWLDRLREVEEDSLFDGAMDTVLFTDLAAWQAERLRLDRELSQFVRKEQNLEEEIRFVTKADHVEIACRKDDALVHLFNHQSLHRGEILRILADHDVPFGNSDILPLIIRPVQPDRHAMEQASAPDDR